MASVTQKYNNPNKGKRRIKKDKNVHFFELGKACQIILEDYYIQINVDGYEEFILEYIQSNEMLPTIQFELAKNALLWYHYFTSLRSILLYVIENIKDEHEYYKSKKPRNARKHPMKDMMDLKTSEIKLIQLYLGSVEAQIDLCDKIHFNMKKDFLKNVV